MADGMRDDETLIDETRFRELVEKYLDAAATQAEVDQLQAAVAGRRDYRKLFVALCVQDEALSHVVREASSVRDLSEEAQLEHAIIDSVIQEGLLRRLADEQTQAEAVKPGPPATVRRSLAGPSPSPCVIVIPRLTVYAGVAAVLLICAMLVFRIASPPDRTPKDAPIADQADPSPRPSAPLPVLAWVVGGVDAVWSSPRPEAVGAGLVAGVYALEAGMAEVELADGARLVIEAPCRFELTGANDMRVHDGRLYAEVPPRATGFTIETQSARLVDVGTAFGVVVDPTGTQLHVFEGEVRAAAWANLDAQPALVPVYAGQAVRVDTGDFVVQPIRFDPGVVANAPTRTIDLVDVVAGGDGTSGRTERGIDLATGTVRDRSLAGAPGAAFDTPLQTGWRDVPAMPLVAGVFTPVGQEPVRVAKDGSTHRGFSAPSPNTFGYLWAGRTLPLPDGYRFDPGEVDARMPNAAAPEHGWLVVNANKGICFDLDAMRAQHTGLRPVKLTAVLMHIGARDQRADTSRGYEGTDVWVFVDGHPALHRADLKPEHDAIDFELDLPASARSVSFAVSLGSDGRQWGDWVLVVDPVIEMQRDERLDERSEN